MYTYTYYIYIYIYLETTKTMCTPIYLVITIMVLQQLMLLGHTICGYTMPLP